MVRLKKLDTVPDFDSYIDGVLRKRGLSAFHREFEPVSLAVDEHTLHLDVLAKPGAIATIIAIHGTAVYGLFYVELCYTLAQSGFNVITFDHRGHGRSSGQRGRFTVSQLLQDVHSVISYSVHRFGPLVFLVGSSQGGIIAFYAAASDCRVKGIACKNIADLAARETDKLTRRPWLTRLLKPMLRTLARLCPGLQIPLVFYLDLNSLKMRYYEDFRTYLLQDPWALKSISLEALASLASTALPCKMEDIETPIFLLQSEEDGIFPLSYVQHLFSSLRCQKQLVVLSGEHGHLLFSEHVELVAPLIAAWFHELEDQLIRRDSANALPQAPGDRGLPSH